MEAQLTAFRSEIEQVRASLDGQLFFPPPGSPKPCTVGGVVCRTSTQVIAAFTPGMPERCTPQEWAEIADLVRESVRLSMTVSPTTTLSRMQKTTSFIVWCLRAEVPLHAEVVFTPARVEQYVATQMRHRSARGQATVRVELRCVARACTTRAGWDRPATRLDKGPRVNPPYTPGEVDGFWAAAAAQSTPYRRHVFATVLTTGLGAGLAGTEMLELRTSQVIDHPIHDGLLVLALMDRLVPVRDGVSDMLRHLCDTQPSGRLIAGSATVVNHRQQLTRMISHLDLPATLPTLNTRRLRTTWAVECLTGGMNVAEFSHAAGINADAGSTLGRYVRYVPMREYDDTWMLSAAGLSDPSSALPTRSALTAMRGA